MSNMKVTVATLMVGVAQVGAKCANDCNSKGECNALNQCECFPNFRGPDCSFRICPAGKAFIDTPLGDVDGDGDVGVDLVHLKDMSRMPASELYHADYAAARPAFMNTQAWDEAHFYAECSNKGECDPIQGVCICYPGFDGSACNRNACPDDCSGHGTCKNYEGSTYAGWDIEATTYCDCDARWTGPSCSLRTCGQGVDPVETANVDTSRMQRIAFKTIGPLSWEDPEFEMEKYPFGDVHFTLTATDEYGDEWTTELMTLKYDTFFADSEEVGETYFIPRLLTANETVGKRSRHHVSETVEDALEAFPHNSIGDVAVSEIYTMLSVVNFDDEFDAFRFFYTDYAGLECGLTDIYEQDATAPNPSVIGCGLPNADAFLGINSGNDRNGQNDIVQYMADDIPYVMLVGTGDRYNPASFDSPIVIDATFGNIQPGDPTVQEGHLNVGDSAGTIFSFGYAYYMYPPYNNDDEPELRFPLFGDPDSVTSIFYTEEYSRLFLFDFDDSVAGLTSASTNYLAGLSLFIRFDKTVITSLLRVDYFYSNANVLLFENFKSDVQATDWATILLQSGYDNVVGQTYEGCSEAVCDNAVEIVAVHDIGSQRVWDVLYHGVQKHFLGDGNFGADAEMHECSKRGICDFETGLCNCFTGYSGLDCNTVSALAFGI